MDDRELSREIEKAALYGFEELDLAGRGIVSLPSTIGQLDRLKVLHLSWNQLTELPKEIGDLSSLTKLHIHKNKLSSLPPEIGDLALLEMLELRDNNLKSLPVELGKIRNLRVLQLGGNQNLELCEELFELSNLVKLDLGGCSLPLLPASIGNLAQLEGLYISYNSLTCLPHQIGNLVSLKELDVGYNKLLSLTRNIGNLRNLKVLKLHGNEIKEIPSEVGSLRNLTLLYMYENKLTSLPVEIGYLTKLEELALTKNDKLMDPPPGISTQGTTAVITFFRERLKGSYRQWVSKLLLVGQSGVGKTSLLRALKDEHFIEGLDPTHGIKTDRLTLQHPEVTNVKMTLTTWDFGGEDICHATHQFFLTDQSLYLLVWDARRGWQAGKLRYWLDLIHAKAPNSPILVVVTHIDQSNSSIPKLELSREYTHIVGFHEVSNKSNTGISDLRKKIQDAAAKLPLMGRKWPASWLTVANAIRDLPDNFVQPHELYKLMAKRGIHDKKARILLELLHKMGELLYFREYQELRNIVVLKPQWVTNAINKVIKSSAVKMNGGLLTQQIISELWSDIPEYARDHLLSLMELFDLSRRTLENRNASLILPLLPDSPTDDLKKQYKLWKNRYGSEEISMKFEFGSMPPGIATAFIARSHTLTLEQYWLHGVLLRDLGKHEHLALLEVFEHKNYLRLSVTGPVPHNFFSTLRSRLEHILEMFPGIEPDRKITCPGHHGNECPHEFKLEYIVNAQKLKKLTVQCPRELRQVSVPGLLYGWHMSTQEGIYEELKRLRQEQQKILQKCSESEELTVKTFDKANSIITMLQENRSQLQRHFTRFFSWAQKDEEFSCPNVFTLEPLNGRVWTGKMLSQKVVLQLYCQCPGRWHATKNGGRYTIKMSPEWMKKMTPYLIKLSRVLKFAAPLAEPAANIIMGQIERTFQDHFKMIDELSEKLLAESGITSEELAEQLKTMENPERISGAPLRTLKVLLKKLDPTCQWGRLQRRPTSEGDYLWLCQDCLPMFDIQPDEGLVRKSRDESAETSGPLKPSKIREIRRKSKSSQRAPLVQEDT